MRILGLGDSLTYGYGVPYGQGWFDLMRGYFPGHIWDNCGIPGDSSTGMLLRFNRDVQTKQPEYVTVLGGVNDLMGGAAPESVVNNLMQISESARAHKVVPLLLLPLAVSFRPRASGWLTGGEALKVNSRISVLREQLSLLAQDKNLLCFDTMSVLTAPADIEPYFLADGVHVDAKMHELIAEGLRAYHSF